MDLLTKEYTDIIEKHLPAQVGSVLQTVLKDADHNKVRIQQLEEKVANLQQTIFEKNAKIAQFENKQILYNNLEARKTELDELERKLKIDVLTYKLEAETQKTAFCKDVALGLVRNTEYRKSAYNNRVEPTNQNGYTSTMTFTDSAGETTTTH